MPAPSHNRVRCEVNANELLRATCGIGNVCVFRTLADGSALDDRREPCVCQCLSDGLSSTVDKNTTRETSRDCRRLATWQFGGEADLWANRRGGETSHV